MKALLTASTEGFDSALKRAKAALDDLNNSTGSAGKAIELLKTGLAGLAGAVSVGAFVNLIKSSIDAADHLNDLSQQTGVSVESLAGLQLSAEQSGVSLDQVAAGIGKLNVQLAQAESGNRKAKEAFDVLGISLKDARGNALSADDALKKIADAFAAAEDGPNKVAAAIRLFGKAGAEMIPLLNGGGEAIQRNKDLVEKYGGVTATVARQADQFNDTLAELDLISAAFGRTLAADLLPNMQVLADRLLDAKKEGQGFKIVADGIADGLSAVALLANSVATLLQSIGIQLGTMADKAKALAKLDLSAYREADAAGMEKQAKASKAYQDSQDRIINGQKYLATAENAGAFDASGTKGITDRKNKIGSLPAGNEGKAGKVDDIAKKLLDQQLKTLDQYISAERDALSTRNDNLNLFYQRDQVSIADYYNVKKTYQAEALANVQGAYGQEIAALEAYIAKTGAAKDGKSEGKVIDAQTKLIEVRGKLSKAETEAANKSLKEWFAQKDAVDRYHDRIDSLAAQISDLGGNSAAAFGANFDRQNRSLTDQMRAVLRSNESPQEERNKALQGIIDLDQLKEQGLATAQLNDLSGQRNVILGELANTQDRLDLQISLGNKSELQGLADISAANRARVGELQKIIDAQQAIAEGIPDPFARSQALVQVDAMRVQLQKLESQTDLVADKFNAMGASAIENLVNKLGTGTAKAKDLLKGLASDLASNFLKMQAKDAGNQLFGKDGLLSGVGTYASSFFPASKDAKAGADAGGVGGFFSKLLGGSGAVGDAGAGAALSSVTAAASPLAPVLSALSTAAQAAATSLSSVSLGSGASSSGGNTGSILSSLFGGSGGVQSSADYASLDLLASANGNVFSGGNVIPFARGGVVSSPAMFPMAGGKKGLMGEAGPEAIVPLKRGADGRLGIATQGSGDNLTVHQTFVLDQPTPRQNQGQLVNAAAKALDRRRRTRSS